MSFRIPGLLLMTALALPACGPSDEVPGDEPAPAPSPQPQPDPDPAPAPGEPTVEVEQVDVSGSNALRVRAGGLPAGQRFVVGFGPPQSEYEVETAVMSDTGGSVDVLVPVPDWFQAGREYVGVVDQQGPGGTRAVSDAFSATPSGDLMMVRATWTDEGVECPAVRSEEGDLYTLTGDTGGFSPGDEVVVVGTPAEMSFCQQGTTLEVAQVRPAAPGD